MIFYSLQASSYLESCNLLWFATSLSCVPAEIIVTWNDKLKIDESLRIDGVWRILEYIWNKFLNKTRKNNFVETRTLLGRVDSSIYRCIVDLS